MQRNRRDTSATVDMNETEPFVYVPPTGGEEFVYPVVLDEDHALTVRQNVYRKLVVDFAIMQMFSGEERPVEVHRVDCCHSEVHSHQHFRSGAESRRTVIASISSVNSWKSVDAQFTPCNDQVMEQYAVNYTMWRKG